MNSAETGTASMHILPKGKKAIYQVLSCSPSICYFLLWIFLQVFLVLSHSLRETVLDGTCWGHLVPWRQDHPHLNQPIQITKSSSTRLGAELECCLQRMPWGLAPGLQQAQQGAHCSSTRPPHRRARSSPWAEPQDTAGRGLGSLPPSVPGPGVKHLPAGAARARHPGGPSGLCRRAQLPRRAPRAPPRPLRAGAGRGLHTPGAAERWRRSPRRGAGAGPAGAEAATPARRRRGKERAGDADVSGPREAAPGPRYRARENNSQRQRPWARRNPWPRGLRPGPALESGGCSSPHSRVMARQ